MRSRLAHGYVPETVASSVFEYLWVRARLIYRLFDAGSDGAQRRGSTLQFAGELLIGADPVKPVHTTIDSGHCCRTASRGSVGVSSRAQAYLDDRCLER